MRALPLALRFEHYAALARHTSNQYVRIASLPPVVTSTRAAGPPYIHLPTWLSSGIPRCGVTGWLFLAILPPGLAFGSIPALLYYPWFLHHQPVARRF